MGEGELVNIQACEHCIHNFKPTQVFFFLYKDFSKPAKRKIRKDWSCGDLYYSTWPDITELTPSQVNNALSSLSNYGAMNEDDKMYLNELVPSIFDYTIHG